LSNEKGLGIKTLRIQKNDFLKMFHSLEFLMIFRFFEHFDSAPTPAGECAHHTAGIWALPTRGMHIRSGGIQSLLVSEIEIDLAKVEVLALSEQTLMFLPFFRYVRESRTLQCEEILMNDLL
jgi:hypothetical protein